MKLWSGSDHNVVKNNKIHENGGWGIELEYADNNTISHNEVWDQQEGGILVSRSVDTELDTNVAQSCEVGIKLDRADKVTVKNNQAFSNATSGIYVDQTSSVKLNYNTALYNATGIYLNESTADVNWNVVCYNTVTDFDVAPSMVGYTGDNNMCDIPDGWTDAGMAAGCTFPCRIPTVSQWGLVIMTLLLLTAAKTVNLRGRSARAFQ